MSLPLRITFEGQDFTYRILTRMITRETTQITISLNDEELTIARNRKGDWDALEPTSAHEPGLIREIARNLALRYKL